MNVIDFDKMTDDYNDSLSITDKCTLNENFIDIIIPRLIFTLPCDFSFLCLISVIIYTLIRPIFNNK